MEPDEIIRQAHNIRQTQPGDHPETWLNVAELAVVVLATLVQQLVLIETTLQNQK